MRRVRQARESLWPRWITPFRLRRHADAKAVISEALAQHHHVVELHRSLSSGELTATAGVTDHARLNRCPRPCLGGEPDIDPTFVVFEIDVRCAGARREAASSREDRNPVEREGALATTSASNFKPLRERAGLRSLPKVEDSRADRRLRLGDGRMRRQCQ